MEQIAILGAGPAGLTAAIYAARAGFTVLVIEGLQPGGQLTTTTTIENWPGSPEGVDGPKLMMDMRAQAERFGVRFLGGEVSGVDFSTRPFAIDAGGGRIQAQCVIVATGASPRLLGLEAERKLMGRGVSVCATCDGFFFRKKDILVVGGGDTAMEEAIFLSGLAASVTVVHRRDALRASLAMQERARAVPNIKYLWNSIIQDIQDISQNKVTGAVIRNTQTGQSAFHPCDGIFLALGHTPNTAFLRGQIELDDKGYVRLKGGAGTNVAGVFSAGDVADPVYKQAITAAGMGCMAALDAERYLKKLT